MSVILFYILVVGTSFSGGVLLRKKIELVLPAVIFTYIEIMYVCGLLDHLRFGFILICISSLFLFIYSIYVIIKGQRIYAEIKKLATLGVVAFTLLYLLYNFSIVGLIAHHNDELSFWAVSTKKMWALDVFYCNPIAEQYSFGNYTPGLQLFEFISTAAAGKFSEWRLYVGYWTYIFSMGCFFLARFKWNKKGVVASVVYTASFFIVGGVFYGALYDNLMVDFALGFTFSFGIAIACFSEDDLGLTIREKTIYICLIANTLVLVKSAGILFASIILVAYGMTLPWRKSWRENLVNRIICFALPFVSFFLWGVKYKSYGQEFATNTDNYNLVEFVNILFNKGDYGYKNEVKTKFFDYLGHTKQSFGSISLTNWQYLIVIIFLLLMIILYCREKSIKIYKSVVALSIVGLVVYWFGLLSTYMYVLSEGDAVALSSMERFVNIYNSSLGALLVFLAVMVVDFDFRDVSLWLILLIPFFLVDPSLTRNLISGYYQKNANAIMGSYESAANFFDTQGRVSQYGERGTVLLVHNGADYPHVAINGFAYLLLPYYRVPWECMYGDSKTFENDTYTHIYSANEFVEHIKDMDVDYIALELLDDKFVELYSELFDHDLSNGQIYKVNSSGKYELVN